MVRLVAVAFVFALTASAQAMPVAPIQPDDTVITVRQGCGVGFQRVAGRCVHNTTARTARRAVRRGIRRY
jgi:hypothetical protein